MRLGMMLFGLMLLMSCKGEPVAKEVETVVPTAGQETVEEDSEAEVRYDPATEDDVFAERVSVKLQEMFGEELEIMTADDRNFRMYALNMDQDDQKETFVLFMSSYFCGSAGCNLLLLDDDLSLVTKFTVTRPPLFIEPTVQNDWRVILVRSEGEWRELRFDGTTYPSNPSMVEKAPYDAPSGHATVLFSNQEPNLPAKVYGF